MAEYDVSIPSIERNGEENDLEEIPFSLSLSLSQDEKTNKVKRSLSIRFSARKKLRGAFIPGWTTRFSRLARTTWPLSYYLYRLCSPDCHYRDYYLRSGRRYGQGRSRRHSCPVFFAKGKSRRNRKEEKIRPCIPSISAHGPYALLLSFLHRFSILARGGWK